MDQNTIVVCTALAVTAFFALRLYAACVMSADCRLRRFFDTLDGTNRVDRPWTSPSTRAVEEPGKSA